MPVSQEMIERPLSYARRLSRSDGFLADDRPAPLSRQFASNYVSFPPPFDSADEYSTQSNITSSSAYGVWTEYVPLVLAAPPGHGSKDPLHLLSLISRHKLEQSIVQPLREGMIDRNLVFWIKDYAKQISLLASAGEIVGCLERLDREDFGSTNSGIYDMIDSEKVSLVVSIDDLEPSSRRPTDVKALLCRVLVVFGVVVALVCAIVAFVQFGKQNGSDNSVQNLTVHLLNASAPIEVGWSVNEHSNKFVYLISDPVSNILTLSFIGKRNLSIADIHLLVLHVDATGMVLGRREISSNNLCEGESAVATSCQAYNLANADNSSSEDAFYCLCSANRNSREKMYQSFQTVLQFNHSRSFIRAAVPCGVWALSEQLWYCGSYEPDGGEQSGMSSSPVIMLRQQSETGAKRSLDVVLPRECGTTADCRLKAAQAADSGLFGIILQSNDKYKLCQYELPQQEGQTIIHALSCFELPKDTADTSRNDYAYKLSLWRDRWLVAKFSGSTQPERCMHLSVFERNGKLTAESSTIFYEREYELHPMGYMGFQFFDSLVGGHLNKNVLYLVFQTGRSHSSSLINATVAVFKFDWGND